MASQSDLYHYLGNGGPVDDTLLRYQNVHRSWKVWNCEVENLSQNNEPLSFRRRMLRTGGVSNQKFIEYMKDADFWDVWRIGNDVVDTAVVTALVERWRPETHTFYMLEEEMTITLQDVSVLLGLPIDGKPATGPQTPP